MQQIKTLIAKITLGLELSNDDLELLQYVKKASQDLAKLCYTMCSCVKENTTTEVTYNVNNYTKNSGT